MNQIFRFLLITTIFITSESLTFWPKIKVIIEGAIPGENVNIHCFSGDNELGYHTLANGDKFTFHFRPNIFHTTKFYCTITTKHGFGSYAVFDNNLRDNYCGKYCHWFIQKNGLFLQIHLNGKQNSEFLCQTWKKPAAVSNSSVSPDAIACRNNLT